MFDDLTLAELTSLRSSVRTAYQKLISGEKTAQIRYGDTGQVFHPASPDHCEKFLALINAAIASRSGGGGGFTVVTG